MTPNPIREWFQTSNPWSLESKALRANGYRFWYQDLWSWLKANRTDICATIGFVITNLLVLYSIMCSK